MGGPAWRPRDQPQPRRLLRFEYALRRGQDRDGELSRARRCVGRQRRQFDPDLARRLPGRIGVAATDASDRAAKWSNFGSHVFVSAPGVSIYSTYPPSSFATLSGTSMATPAVAGLAALLFGQDPSRTPDDVKVILARSADKVGKCAIAPIPRPLPWLYASPKVRLRKDQCPPRARGPDFDLSAFPASRTVKRGTSTSYTLSVARASGFAAAVAPTVSGLPLGSRLSFSPYPVTQSSTLRIRVPKRTRRGTYPLAVSATGDGLTRSLNLFLRVTRQSGARAACAAARRLRGGR